MPEIDQPRTREHIQAEIDELQQRINALRSLPQMQVTVAKQEAPREQTPLQHIIDSVSYARFYSLQQGVITGARDSNGTFVSKEEYLGNLRKDQIPAYDRDIRTDEKLLEVFPHVRDGNKIGSRELCVVAYRNDENRLVVTGTGRMSPDFVNRPNIDRFEFQFPSDKAQEVDDLVGRLQENPQVLQPVLNGLFDNKVYPLTRPPGERQSSFRENRPTICSYPLFQGLKLEFRDLR